MKVVLSPSGADAMDIYSDTSRGLTDHGTILEGIINTLDGIIFHADQEAGAQLRTRSACIEKGRRGMGEITLGHEVICFNSTLDVRSMDSDSNAHKHVLWPLCRHTVDLQ